MIRYEPTQVGLTSNSRIICTIVKVHLFKAAYSVTMNIFFLFKSFVKVKLSYVFTIKMFSTAENCMEK